MTCISTYLLDIVLAVVAQPEQPVDPRWLEGVRDTLASKLSRISSVRLVYDETWVANPNPPPSFASAKERFIRRREEMMKSQGIEPPPPPEEPSEVIRHYEVQDAFPSFKLRIREEYHYADGRVREEVREVYGGDGTVTQLDSREASIVTSTDRSMIPRTPLNAIGLRMQGTVNGPLSEFLSHPEITYGGGEEMVRGFRTAVLRVGPGIATAIGAPLWDDRDSLKLWLAPDYHYLPIRMQISRKRGEGITVEHIYELDDFQPTNDLLRTEAIPFPRYITFTDPLGQTRWQLTEVEINRALGSQAFAPVIPDGTSVTRDGQVQKRVLKGGDSAYEKRVSDTVERARNLLSSIEPPPAATTSSGLTWPTITTLSFAVLVGATLYLKWRKNHVRS